MPLLEKSQRLISRQFQIQGNSMEPAFTDGALVRLSPLPYLWGSPQRGDVVGLLCPEAKERYELKRVVGVPGECVSWRGSDIWINGIRLEEPYAVPSDSVPGDTTRL